MAKRKKRGKLPKRAKRRRGNSATRPKARKAAQAKTVAKAKPKPMLVKKAARKKPVAPAVETVAAEVIEQPVAVTEVEETRQASCTGQLTSALHELKALRHRVVAGSMLKIRPWVC
jgi:hypothetical protein